MNKKANIFSKHIFGTIVRFSLDKRTDVRYNANIDKRTDVRERMCGCDRRYRYEYEKVSQIDEKKLVQETHKETCNNMGGDPLHGLRDAGAYAGE